MRPLAGRWPAAAQGLLGRFSWPDPTVVLDEAADPAAFRTAMNAFYLGGTIKITGTNRHPAADELLLRLDLSTAVILDLGASDGSTSLDLITRLPAFRSFVISDRHLHVRSVQVGTRTVFTDPSGHPVLIVGPRAVAWPGQSPAIARLYHRTLLQAQREAYSNSRDVLLLNPAVRRLIRTDPRVTYRAHDLFQPWTGEPPDVIKIANVLRRLYFTDSAITQALTVVLGDLREGGHLLLVDNPRAKVPARAGLYRRDHDHFTLAAQTTDPPEVADLINTIRLPIDSRADRLPG